MIVRRLLVLGHAARGRFRLCAIRALWIGVPISNDSVLGTFSALLRFGTLSRDQ
jgi:hypothetical protein